MDVIVEHLENSQATLTAYLHDFVADRDSFGDRPAVLVFPGGGYSICSDREAEPVALAYAAAGYQAFVLRYSVGPGSSYEDAFADAESALDRLHQRADDWRIDPSRIAVVGFSAGGHLAAMLSTAGRIRPAAAILCYPVILSSFGPAMDKAIPSASDQVDSRTPPSFIVSTRDDDVVPIANSLAYADALDKAGRPFEIHIFASGHHGLSLARPQTAAGSPDLVNPRFSTWLAMSVDWLKQLWGDFRVAA